MRRQSRFRLLIQLCAAALFNGYFAGFMKNKIYTGQLKKGCVPVLNCYSCPGALGSCPIGSLQTLAAGKPHRISFYVLGTLLLFGTVLGRLVCGFLCPFGLIQDLLHRIPTPKLRVPKKPDRILRFIKYAVLLAVLLLPMLMTDPFGFGEPVFCKYFCPAGTLEGGIPHLLRNPMLRKLAGALFSWKFAVLIAVLTGSVFISRFFCRYFCPLGAFYALFNRFALYQMHVDTDKCNGCGACEAHCPMAVDVTKQINSSECIRCGKCKAACPTGAIRSSFPLKPDSRQQNPQKESS